MKQCKSILGACLTLDKDSEYLAVINMVRSRYYAIKGYPTPSGSHSSSGRHYSMKRLGTNSNQNSPSPRSNHHYHSGHGRTHSNSSGGSPERFNMDRPPSVDFDPEHPFSSLSPVSGHRLVSRYSSSLRDGITRDMFIALVSGDLSEPTNQIPNPGAVKSDANAVVDTRNKEKKDNSTGLAHIVEVDDDYRSINSTMNTTLSSSSSSQHINPDSHNYNDRNHDNSYENHINNTHSDSHRRPPSPQKSRPSMYHTGNQYGSSVGNRTQVLVPRVLTKTSHTSILERRRDRGRSAPIQ